MSFLRVLDPERYKSSEIVEKVIFYEKPRPHVMYHADTREVTLGNGSLIYQISVEDDYSRGYMALCVFPKKLSYFVVLTILRAFRLHRKPELFHHDNGGEYDNGVVSRLLQMLSIVDVPIEVENPKGNGKKERAHSQDRKCFYDNYQFFEKAERIVKENGKVKFEGKRYHVSEKMAGETVEVRDTLRGLKVWHKGAFIKRWKYWEYVSGIAVDYMLKKYLL